jgi:hypothetical protein
MGSLGRAYHRSVGGVSLARTLFALKYGWIRTEWQMEFTSSIYYTQTLPMAQNYCLKNLIVYIVLVVVVVVVIVVIIG